MKAQNIPIILMSTNEKILIDYDQCGAVDIIPKPFNASELIGKIKSALDINHQTA